MAQKIVILRIEQFIRILNEIGFVRVLLVFPFFYLIYGRLGEYVRDEGGWIMGLVFGGIWLNMHLFRKDKDFLKKVYPRPYLIYAVEYSLLSFLVGLLYVEYIDFTTFGIMVISGLIAAVLPFTIKLTNNRPLLYFPKFMGTDFEWICGIRKNAILLIPLYVLGVILSYQTIAVPVALMLLSIIVATFYLEDTESQVFIDVYNKSPEVFIRYKVLRNLGLFWGLTLPLSIGFFIFHYQYWYLFLVLMAVCSLMQLSTIVLKYSMYEPNVSMRQNSVIFAFLVVCWTFPFLHPIPLIMTVMYYRKAKVNLANL